MRSLLVAFDFPPIVSGIGTVFCNLWKLIPGQDNFILAPKVKGYEEIDAKNKMNIIRYFCWGSSSILRTAVLFFYIFRIVGRKKINLLLCSVPVSIGLLGLIFKKITGLPYYVFCYGGEYEKHKGNKLIFWLLNNVLNNADKIITNSEFTSAQVKRFGITEDKIYKVTPGVDTDIFRPGLEVSGLIKKFNLENKQVLLTVSRLVKRKGIDTVINALPLLVKDFPGIIYLVVGSGPEENYFKTMVREKSFERRVVFIGEVSDEDLPRFYNLCDVYVMPNRQTHDFDNIEGFGISFIEASACARPVIGGVSGGSADAVVEGESGFLIYPPDSVEKFTQCLSRLLKDKAYAREIGQKGRKMVEAKYKWEFSARKLEEVLGTS
jgi:phosphatidylinositol alpha-1,6-mannosyltransferase